MRSGFLVKKQSVRTKEFDRSGAKYFAVTPADYVFSDLQDSKYSSRKYNTLAAAEAALDASPSSPQIINILGSWDTNDGPVLFDGVSTSAENYILVRTIGVARHNGIPHGSTGASTTAHRIVRSSGSGHITEIADPYVKFEGLQMIMTTGAGGASDEGCRVSASYATLDKCLVSSYSTISGQDGIHITIGTVGNLTVTNCLVTGWARAGITIQFYTSGAYSSTGNFFANNTVVSNNTNDAGAFSGGIVLYNASGTNDAIEVALYNNLVVGHNFGSGVDMVRAGAFTVIHSGSGNAAGIISNLGGLTASQVPVGFSEVDFADEANRDYHLTATSEIIGDGTNLSSDPDHPFSDDANEKRRLLWDIGAFEYKP